MLGSKPRMPRSQKITAGRAAREEVLAREEPLLDGGGHRALEEHGPPGASDGLEEREVLHVARAHLHEVGVLGHEAHVALAERLGDDLEAVGVGGAAEPAERVLAVTLEGVGRRAGLVRAAAEEGRAPRRRPSPAMAWMRASLSTAQGPHRKAGRPARRWRRRARRRRAPGRRRAGAARAARPHRPRRRCRGEVRARTAVEAGDDVVGDARAVVEGGDPEPARDELPCGRSRRRRPVGA